MGRLACLTTRSGFDLVSIVPVSTALRAVAAERALPGACSASREARLDALFEQLVRAFRADLMSALVHEPAGPARHLRAYLRRVCDALVRLAPRRQRLALLLLTRPRYHDIWCDFVAEACAGDTFDHDLSHRCRAAVDALWLRQAAHAVHAAGDCEHDDLAAAPFTKQSAAAIRDYLLSLSDTAPVDPRTAGERVAVATADVPPRNRQH